WPGDALDQDATVDAQLGALLGAQVGHAQPERIAGRLGRFGLLVRRTRLPVGLHFTDGDGQVAVLAAAPHPDVDLRPGRGTADDARQVARALDLATVEPDGDVAHLDPCPVGRSARLDAAHQGALRIGQAQRLGDFLGYLRDTDTDAAAHHPATRLELLGDVHRLVDRDGEGDAHEAG